MKIHFAKVKIFFKVLGFVNLIVGILWDHELVLLLKIPEIGYKSFYKIGPIHIDHPVDFSWGERQAKKNY